MKTKDMIYRLKEGQKAICENFGVEVLKELGGIIVKVNKHGGYHLGKPLPLSPVVLNDFDWRIIHEPISFEEMRSEINKGNYITSTLDGIVYGHYNSKNNRVSFDEIINGEWYKGMLSINDFK